MNIFRGSQTNLLTCHVFCGDPVSERRNDMMLSNAELECCDNLMYSITIAKVLSKSATIYCIQQSMFVKLYCWRSH